MFTRKFMDGKYTVSHTHGTNLNAMRNNEPWRDLTGDGLVLSMLQEVEHLDDTIAEQAKLIEALEAQIKSAQPLEQPGPAAEFTSVKDAMPELRSDFSYSQRIYLVRVGRAVLPARLTRGIHLGDNRWDCSPEAMLSFGWICPDRRDVITGVTAWLAISDVTKLSPDNRMKRHVEAFATAAGWTYGSGEGAFEFVQRTSYKQGWDDCKAEALNGGRRP